MWLKILMFRYFQASVLNILWENFRMENSDECGSGSYSSIIFLGQIWLDKENRGFSAPVFTQNIFSGKY